MPSTKIPEGFSIVNLTKELAKINLLALTALITVIGILFNLEHLLV